MTFVEFESAVPPTIQSTSFDSCDNLKITIPTGEASLKAYLASCWNDATLLKIPYLLDPANLPAGYWIEYTTTDDQPVQFKNINPFYTCYLNGKCVALSRSLITSFGGFVSGRERILTCTLPESVSVIAEFAFDTCSNLKNVNIPINVSRIEKYTFRDCGLTDVIIPENIRYLGEGAFIRCSNLVNLEIKPGLEVIGFGAFQYCSALTTLTLPNTVKRIGEDYGAVFLGCDRLTSITLPENLIDLGDETFTSCSNLKDIVLPNSLSKIGHRVFLGCSSLSNINIPDGVTEIGEYAFGGCSSLSNINFPEGVESIGECVLEYCYNIQRITFPSTLNTLGKHIFGDHSYNTHSVIIYCNALIPPTLSGELISGYNAGSNKVYIKVPSAALNDYKQDALWKKYSLRAIEL